MFYIKIIFRVLASVALIALIWHRIPIGSFDTYLKSAHLVWLGAAFLLLLFAFFISALKWFRLGNNVFGLSFPLSRYIHVFFAGFFYQMFLPGGQLVGEGMKVLRLSGIAGETRSVVASQFIDRVTGFVALTGLLSIAFFMDSRLVYNHINQVLFVFILGIGCAGVVLLFAPIIYKLIPNRFSLWADPFKALSSRKRELITTIGIATCAHMCSAGAMMLVLKSVGIEVSFLYIIWTYLIIGIVLLMPVSYAGIGFREGTTLYYLGAIGIPYGQIFAASILFLFIQVSVALVGGMYEFAFLWQKREKRV